MGKSPGKSWEAVKSQSRAAADPAAERFVQSLSHDRRLYKHDITGSIAHARMLAKTGLITGKDLTQICRGLRKIEKQIDVQGDGWPGWKVELEDIHMCIEAALIELAGDAGRKLHTGRSRNDQVALDLKLWTFKQALPDLQNLFATLFKRFIRLADRDGLIVMPSYTHLQRAQPIVAGGELMAWLTAFARAKDRFDRLADIDGNPLGSGAIAGSALPLDRVHTAESLFIGGPTFNAIDATATRDNALDFVFGLAMTAMTLSRWAEQWIIYASQEFGFIALDERYTTGSSMMPQKRNPDMLELIRGRCGGVYGQLVALLTISKGLPVGYNRDLQEDKCHVFQAYDSVVGCLDMAARVVGTTKFNKQRIADGLDRGFIDATSLAEYLVTRGVPFRTSHQIVGQLVRLCEQKGMDQLSQLSADDFSGACKQAGVGADRCGGDVYDWLGAANVVRRYRTAGNAGLTGFKRQLGAWKRRLKT